jgi:transcription factor IIIB subunit 2
LCCGGGCGCVAATLSPFLHPILQIAIQNGRRYIQELAGKLLLGQHVVDSAHRLYMMAVQRNFVQGRKTFVVVAACLYVVCRREKSDHLLIDFSDSLEVCTALGFILHLVLLA